MNQSLSEQRDCVLCNNPYSPQIKAEEGQTAYPVYCSSCPKCVAIQLSSPVRVTFRRALKMEDETLAQAIQEALVNCSCGEEFRHDAGGRCRDCIEKIHKERKTTNPEVIGLKTIWDTEKLKRWEEPIFKYILGKMESGGETLAQLIEKFEAGEISPEEYMEKIEELQHRESSQLSAIQTWAMILGKGAYRAAEDLGMVERYGSRILVTIASGLEKSTGQPLINILTNEMKNWDGTVQKELRTYIAKTTGG